MPAKKPTKPAQPTKTTKQSREAKAKVEPPDSTQPVSERRAAEAQLQALVTSLAPDHKRLIAATRKSLRTRLPSAHEVVYEYSDAIVISLSPSGRGHEGVLAIRASAKKGVQLYFNYGKDLPDPEKRLKGSGGQARFIALEGVSTLSLPPVAKLIADAIARNPVPFAKDGTGSVTNRPTTATPRAPR